MSLLELPEDLKHEVMQRTERLSRGGAMTMRAAAHAALIQCIEIRRLALSAEYAKGLSGVPVCVTLLTQVTLLELAAKALP